jgi:molybdopterin converting factor small subunit
MKTENLVLLEELCSHYSVEQTFVLNLNEIGLIRIVVVEDHRYIHHDTVRDLEKMIRMHQELEVNPAGIDVVFNLLQKIDELNEELSSAKEKLSLFEEQGD